MFWDIVIGVVAGAVVISVVTVSIIKKKKGKSSCCGDCSECCRCGYSQTNTGKNENSNP